MEAYRTLLTGELARSLPTLFAWQWYKPYCKIFISIYLHIDQSLEVNALTKMSFWYTRKNSNTKHWLVNFNTWTFRRRFRVRCNFSICSLFSKREVLTPSLLDWTDIICNMRVAKLPLVHILFIERASTKVIEIKIIHTPS